MWSIVIICYNRVIGVRSEFSFIRVNSLVVNRKPGDRGVNVNAYNPSVGTYASNFDWKSVVFVINDQIKIHLINE